MEKKDWLRASFGLNMASTKMKQQGDFERYNSSTGHYKQQQHHSGMMALPSSRELSPQSSKSKLTKNRRSRSSRCLAASPSDRSVDTTVASSQSGSTRKSGRPGLGEFFASQNQKARSQQQQQQHQRRQSGGEDRYCVSSRASVKTVRTVETARSGSQGYSSRPSQVRERARASREARVAQFLSSSENPSRMVQTSSRTNSANVLMRSSVEYAGSRQGRPSNMDTRSAGAENPATMDRRRRVQRTRSAESPNLMMGGDTSARQMRAGRRTRTGANRSAARRVAHPGEAGQMTKIEETINALPRAEGCFEADASNMEEAHWSKSLDDSFSVSELGQSFADLSVCTAPAAALMKSNPRLHQSFNRSTTKRRARRREAPSGAGVLHHSLNHLGFHDSLSVAEAFGDCSGDCSMDGCEEVVISVPQHNRSIPEDSQDANSERPRVQTHPQATSRPSVRRAQSERFHFNETSIPAAARSSRPSYQRRMSTSRESEGNGSTCSPGVDRARSACSERPVVLPFEESIIVVPNQTRQPHQSQWAQGGQLSSSRSGDAGPLRGTPPTTPDDSGNISALTFGSDNMHEKFDDYRMNAGGSYSHVLMSSHLASLPVYSNPATAMPFPQGPHYEGARVPRSAQDNLIEIAPGVWERLRGAQETWQAIERDHFSPATCPACGTDLCCISDASFVICPKCRHVSPLCQGNAVDGKQPCGVGLGFTMEDLAQFQQEIITSRKQGGPSGCGR